MKVPTEFAPRPWSLEVEYPEPPNADGSPTPKVWRVWSTYVGLEKAEERAEKLRSKGYAARVSGICELCEERHSTPHDGSCLL